MLTPEEQPERPPRSRAEAFDASSKESCSNQSVAELTGEFLPKGRPALSYQNLRTVYSWEGLKSAYAAQGVVLSADADYLELVKADWKAIRSVLTHEALTSELPSEYPHVTVEVEGKPVDLFGIWHHHGMHPDVALLLYTALARCPLILAEQNLGLLDGARFSNGLDLPDHFARGALSAVGLSESSQLLNARTWLRRVFNRDSDRVRGIVGDDFLSAATLEGEEIEKRQRELGVKDNVIAALSKLSLFMPGDTGSDLPANVDLAYKHEKGLRYTLSQARSAYMAEFLRSWNIELTFERHGPDLPKEQIAQLVSRKKLLCGQAHLPEIVFFLQHGSREAQVTERAKRDTAAFEHEGINGLLAVHRRNAAHYWACEIPLCLAKGGLFGLAFSRIIDLIL